MICRQCESERIGKPERGICTCKPRKNLIDPAELLRLIEATMPYEIELYDYRLEVIVKYLSGDHKPLEELAGVE